MQTAGKDSRARIWQDQRINLETEIARLRVALKEAWEAIMAGDTADALGTISRALANEQSTT